MGNEKLIEEILINNEKVIHHNKGNIFHILKKNQEGYHGFGEVYFSKIKFNNIKAWKKHYEMICNFVVVHGIIKIVVFDNRDKSKTKNLFNEFVLSKDNYCRLTIPAGLWYGFKGVEECDNILLNFSNIKHNPAEQVSQEINLITYKW